MGPSGEPGPPPLSSSATPSRFISRIRGGHVGGVGDGGIDGLITLDRLGFQKVGVQAKRWQGTVERSAVQAFFGALAQRHAHRGVMITTSTFSNGAKQFAEQVSDKIVLVDGERLADLMIDHGVGVSHEKVLLPKLDRDYFEDAWRRIRRTVRWTVAQDRASGAEAARWGYAMARRVGAKLGARFLSANSNECEFRGHRSVIKSARVGDTFVGVTYKMLDRVSTVVANFEQDDGTYHLFEITAAQFRAHMRDSAGAGRGKVGLVSRTAFLSVRGAFAVFEPHDLE